MISTGRSQLCAPHFPVDAPPSEVIWLVDWTSFSAARFCGRHTQLQLFQDRATTDPRFGCLFPFSTSTNIIDRKQRTFSRFPTGSFGPFCLVFFNLIHVLGHLFAISSTWPPLTITYPVLITTSRSFYPRPPSPQWHLSDPRTENWNRALWGLGLGAVPAFLSFAFLSFLLFLFFFSVWWFPVPPFHCVVLLFSHGAGTMPFITAELGWAIRNPQSFTILNTTAIPVLEGGTVNHSHQSWPWPFTWEELRENRNRDCRFVSSLTKGKHKIWH